VVLREKRQNSYKHLINDKPEGVPIDFEGMTAILDDFWSQILGCAAIRLGFILA